MTPDRVVQVEVAHGVATLTLDSPANRNALSRAMRAQLRAALDDALGDDAVRVVVLDHTGRVFCSGMDLGEAAGSGSQDQGVREFPDLLEAIWSAPKPVVAVVRGPARAGGVGLLAASDRSIPEQKTRPVWSSTTTRTVSSASASASACRSWARSARESALRLAGESRVSVATPRATARQDARVTSDVVVRVEVARGRHTGSR